MHLYAKFESPAPKGKVPRRPHFFWSSTLKSEILARNLSNEPLITELLVRFSSVLMMKYFHFSYLGKGPSGDDFDNRPGRKNQWKDQQGDSDHNRNRQNDVEPRTKRSRWGENSEDSNEKGMSCFLSFLSYLPFPSLSLSLSLSPHILSPIILNNLFK